MPHVTGGEGETSLGRSLVNQWPSYAGYVVSFLTLGTMWINHHNRFRYISRVDQSLLSLNTLLLMTIAFVPFSTALLADYITGTYSQQVIASAVYTGTLTANAVLFTILWQYAAGGRRLVDDRLSDDDLGGYTRRYRVGLSLYVLAFVLSFVWFPAALVMTAALAGLFLLPEPSRNVRRRETDAEPLSGD